MLLEFNETLILNYVDAIIGATIILTLISPPMIMIDLLFSDIFGDMEPLDRKKFDVGMIIGMFERIIVLLLVLLNSITAIVLVITVKTWARSDAIKKDPEFGNKYLVGTLASILVALIAAYLWVLLIG